jgi:hypothetical protein
MTARAHHRGRLDVVRFALAAVLAAAIFAMSATAAAKPTLYQALLERPTPAQLHGVTLMAFQAVSSVDVEAFNAELSPRGCGNRRQWWRYGPYLARRRDLVSHRQRVGCRLARWLRA